MLSIYIHGFIGTGRQVDGKGFRSKIPLCAMNPMSCF